MSISKIAKALNVSKASVSLVINGKAEKSRISKDLEKRILDYVEEIGFKPNAVAKSLATGKSHSIGLVVENIGDSFFGPIALHIEACLRPHGYHVAYSSTIGEDEVAEDIIDNMMERKVAGIILAPTTKLDKQVQKILDINMPLVIFDRHALASDTAYVGTNNYEASHVAVHHLFQQGYTKLGMITNDSLQSQMQERKLAYEDLLKEKGIEPVILKVPFLSTQNERVDLILDFLSKNDLDALYFSTNYLCISGIKALNKRGKNWSYGVLSFDDHEVFDVLNPSITCVRQPIAKIAEQIVDSLFEQINTTSATIRKDIIPSELIIRSSTQGKQSSG